MTAIAEALPGPLRPIRRSADSAEDRQARDRLLTTLILAGTLHGLVILGVSFTAPASHGDGASQGLEILLVSDELPAARNNDTATYLSQRTQTGSGNTRERLPAQLPSRAQPAASSAAESAPARRTDSADKALASAGSRRTILQKVAQPEPKVAPAAPAPPQPAMSRLAADDTLRLRGETRDELYITPDTRASRPGLAPYLDGWRRRVERIGTVNFPSAAARRRLSGNPVIEVALQRDGTLQSARIQHSSGHPEIDAAALAILHLASPFEPFPPELAREYRVLRFAYEWQFEGAKSAPGVVTIP